MSGERKASSPIEIYELEITLLDIEPRIWRRFAVQGNVTLARLHDVIQAVMGWTDSHLHEFIVGENRYTAFYPNMDWDFLEGMIDEEMVKLCELVKEPRARFIYEYDFGDSWQHELVVREIGPPKPGVHYPMCLAGERACPPEDCGGIGGYQDLLEAISDPSHEEHAELLEWVGGAFDPEAFDLEEANRFLRSL